MNGTLSVAFATLVVPHDQIYIVELRLTTYVYSIESTKSGLNLSARPANAVRQPGIIMTGTGDRL